MPSAITPHPVITAAMGTAVPLCKCPSKALEHPAKVNCKVPSKAEAIPARSPNGAMAAAVEFGKLNPKLVIAQNRHSRAGGNRSATHVDFMIGSGALDIDGIRSGGAVEPLIGKGEWADA